jgi:GT2 family glycosyltransferase
MAEIGVVIGNHQGEAVLGDCLESLARQSEPPAEVIVVDGASTDGSRAVAEARGARWLDRPNLGLGHLYNSGTAATKAAYVLLSNNDVAYDERCLELLRRALDDDASLFAADPRQLDWEGERVVHARTTLRRGALLHEYFPGLHLEDAVETDTPTPTVSAHGAAMLVRRERFLELGGFDETFFMEWEDLDLCWRAWLRGWGSLYVPHARLRHRVGAVTTSSVLPRRSASSHHNLVRFALKCLPAREAATVVGGELLRLPRHPRAVALGLARATGELPEILRLRRRLRPRRDLLEWLLGGQTGPPPPLT